MKYVVVTFLLFTALAWSAADSARAQVLRYHADTRPKIAEVLEESDIRKMIQGRSIISHTSLVKLEGKNDEDIRRYDFYTAMLVEADLERAREVIMDYGTYKRLVPYINETTFYPSLSMLLVTGGIWRYQLAALVQFKEQHQQWIEYQIVKGHFKNLAGDILFEPVDDQRTLVLIRGKRVGEGYPPRWVAEHGAEVVFRHTARKMRSDVESN